VVDQRTTPPASPTATATPAPVLPTPTPVIRVIGTEPTATALPIPTATPRPAPTIGPASGPPAAPTVAPSREVRLDFTAADWVGGYYQGNGRFYGRAWVAIYGAQSAYPRAALAFTLDAAPSGAASIDITGLYDVWAAQNEIALEVNGLRVFRGASPFRNWDGVGNGANAAWSSASFTIPAGALRAGANEIAVANLTPGANFGAPPYVLLADASLVVPGSGQPTPPANSTAEFAAEDWRGGYYQGTGRFYGRPWVAVYGAQSPYPRATLRFRLDGQPSGPVTVTIDGLDDELAAANPIAIEVNGLQVFTGPSPFANWDGVGNGANARWTQATITIPAALVHQGRNEIAIANLSPSANVGAPPYILLSETTVTAPGATVKAAREAS
jgi:hypothetical protein